MTNEEKEHADAVDELGFTPEERRRLEKALYPFMTLEEAMKPSIPISPRLRKHGEGIIHLQILQTPGLTAEELVEKLRHKKYGRKKWTKARREYYFSWPEERLAKALASLLDDEMIDYVVDQDGRKRYYTKGQMRSIKTVKGGTTTR